MPLVGKTTTIPNKEYSYFEDIFNHISDPLLVKDSNYHFVLVNDAACAFTGLQRSEIIGRNDYELFQKDQADVFRRTDKEVLETGEDVVNVENFTDPTGKTYIISTKKSLYITPAGEKFLVLIVRDITEIKKTEKHLLQSVNQLAEFAYVASHDLKSPLSTIKNFTELIHKKYQATLPTEAVEMLDLVKKAAANAALLVEDLLKHSTTTNTTEQIIPINLTTIIEQVESDLSKAILESSGKIQYANLPTINGSKVRIYQLFQNLINNAIKFQKEGIPPIIRITHKVVDEGHEISVTDNGIGIKAENLEKVFQIFTRLNAKTKYTGSGIGLATCKKVIHQMGGKIRVTSEFGKGTSFIIFFPHIKQ